MLIALAALLPATNTDARRVLSVADETRDQLTRTRAALGELESSLDVIMDRKQKRRPVRALPQRAGVWQFRFETDKIPDEEQLKAFGYIEGSHANYELSVICRSRGLELLISTFENRGTDSKRIPWSIDVAGTVAYERVRLRID